eukprot:570481-Amphidinium_carterae.1
MEKAKSCPAPLPLRWKPELREAAAGSSNSEYPPFMLHRCSLPSFSGDEMVTNGNGWKSKLHAAASELSGPAANVALDVTSLMKQLEQQVALPKFTGLTGGLTHGKGPIS